MLKGGKYDHDMRQYENNYIVHVTYSGQKPQNKAHIKSNKTLIQ